MKTASIFFRIGKSHITSGILVEHLKNIYPNERKSPKESSLQLYSAENGRVYLDFLKVNHNTFELVVSFGSPPISIDVLVDDTEKVFVQLSRDLRTALLKPKDMYFDLVVESEGKKESLIRATPYEWRDVFSHLLKDDIAPKICTLLAIIIAARFLTTSSNDPWLGPLAALIGTATYSLYIILAHIIKQENRIKYQLPGRERIIGQ